MSFKRISFYMERILRFVRLSDVNNLPILIQTKILNNFDDVEEKTTKSTGLAAAQSKVLVLFSAL